MPKWLRTWLIGSGVYLGVHLLGNALFGASPHDPFRSLPLLALGSVVSGGALSWLQAVGARPKPPK